MLKFKAKVYRIGTSWAITVPKLYVENGLIEAGEKYVFRVGKKAAVEKNLKGDESQTPGPLLALRERLFPSIF